MCQNKRKDKDVGRNVSICWKGIDEEGEVDYVEQMENSNIRVNIFFLIKEEEHYTICTRYLFILLQRIYNWDNPAGPN